MSVDLLLSRVPVTKWGCAEVLAWFRTLELRHLHEAFETRRYSGAQLLNLTWNDLSFVKNPNELIRILVAIGSLREANQAIHAPGGASKPIELSDDARSPAAAAAAAAARRPAASNKPPKVGGRKRKAGKNAAGVTPPRRSKRLQKEAKKEGDPRGPPSAVVVVDDAVERKANGVVQRVDLDGDDELVVINHKISPSKKRQRGVKRKQPDPNRVVLDDAFGDFIDMTEDTPPHVPNGKQEVFELPNGFPRHPAASSSSSRPAASSALVPAAGGTPKPAAAAAVMADELRFKSCRKCRKLGLETVLHKNPQCECIHCELCIRIHVLAYLKSPALRSARVLCPTSSQISDEEFEAVARELEGVNDDGQDAQPDAQGESSAPSKKKRKVDRGQSNHNGDALSALIEEDREGSSSSSSSSSSSRASSKKKKAAAAPPRWVCSVELPQETISACCTRTEFDQFSQLEFERLIYGDKSDFVHCPNKESCGAVFQFVPRDPMSAVTVMKDDAGRPLTQEAFRDFCENRARCSSCTLTFCRRCQATPYHTGYTCDGFASYAKSAHCRFCEAQMTDSNRAPHSDALAQVPVFRDVCTTKECLDRRKTACRKMLPCGHPCLGIAGETHHPPCLRDDCKSKSELIAPSTKDEVMSEDAVLRYASELASSESKSNSALPPPPPPPPPPVAGSAAAPPPAAASSSSSSPAVSSAPVAMKVPIPDGSDYCNICWVESLTAAPVVQLDCGHFFHLHCVKSKLEKRWPGVRLTFGFADCPLCKKPISHSSLKESHLDQVEALRKMIERKAVKRLQVEKLDKDKRMTDPASRFYQKPVEFAMASYAYYECFKCKQPFFGGRRDCEQNAEGDRSKPEEFVCFDCSPPTKVKCKIPAHREYHVFKCRFCCAVAVWFCWGTTHFCDKCHSHPQLGARTRWPKSKFAQCLGRDRCPLGVEHAPNGSTPDCEFSLGCGVCQEEKSKRDAIQESELKIEAELGIHRERRQPPPPEPEQEPPHQRKKRQRKKKALDRAAANGLLGARRQAAMLAAREVAARAAANPPRPRYRREIMPGPPGGRGGRQRQARRGGRRRAAAAAGLPPEAPRHQQAAAAAAAVAIEAAVHAARVRQNPLAAAQRMREAEIAAIARPPPPQLPPPPQHLPPGYYDAAAAAGGGGGGARRRR